MEVALLLLVLSGSVKAGDILSLLPSNCVAENSGQVVHPFGNVQPSVNVSDTFEGMANITTSVVNRIKNETLAEEAFCTCLTDNGLNLETGIRHQLRRSRHALATAYNCTKQYSDRMRLQLHFPLYYSMPYRAVGAIFQGTVFVVGFLGNILVVVVVYRSRAMHTPTNCYLVSLAVADITVLIAAVPNEVFMYFLVAQAWRWGNAGCAILVFLQNMGINASALSVTAFTVERFIAICLPLKARTICTVSRAKRIILAVWVFAFLYCIPWVFLTKVSPVRYIGVSDVQQCTFKLTRQAYLGYFFADIVLFYVVPLLVSSVLYTRIAVVVFRPPMVLKQSEGPGGVVAEVIKMLVMVVSLFALLWLPYRSMLVYNSFAQTAEDKYMDLWFLMFAKTCVYINSAINPILYNAMSAKFRRAFRQAFRLIRCKQRPAAYYGMEVISSGLQRSGVTVRGTPGRAVHRSYV
ncbi:thyrotropin-releasing hormone receptor-like [Amphibalanus amphitrite]|uniref:thyrotropin-releasing hormone receptor-like n=1 Tax=Amphibalanus amphitrite TaxID=1232801 RepID=UPI001C928DD2|nr:thyrotropin-releasing hormone receptor-like [Amphibalanus amphitrite]